ncbi:hypothetical protein F5X99DRAFT_155430 [Biscogniauxia marginata]|nr:hypothetical protein F5X99DRAFT_155430 [Biscogniauxia marginata]
MFIANYKGGRNESFMYGVDTEQTWYDYDLTSAYTTGMTMLGNPDYKKSVTLKQEELKKLSDLELVENYLIMKVNFKFPKKVKYPSIPSHLDETTTIYPLNGESIITGIEYLVARNQGCEFTEIKDIFLIPFERIVNPDTKTVLVVNQPFAKIIETLQVERGKYPKRSLGNLMEKEKGNSIYGNVVRGMSNKKKFDIKTGRTTRMEGSVLSNPIIAS